MGSDSLSGSDNCTVYSQCILCESIHCYCKSNYSSKNVVIPDILTRTHACTRTRTLTSTTTHMNSVDRVTQWYTKLLSGEAEVRQGHGTAWGCSSNSWEMVQVSARAWGLSVDRCIDLTVPRSVDRLGVVEGYMAEALVLSISPGAIAR